MLAKAAESGLLRLGVERVRAGILEKLTCALLGAVCVLGCGPDAEPSRPEARPQVDARTVADTTPIVFRSQLADGAGDLYVMAADGSGMRAVAKDGDFFVPEWSPDGATIAFRSNATGMNAEVGVMTLDGSSEVLLTEGENSRSSNMAVHWLPDGQSLVYASWPQPDSLRLWEISQYGGAPQRLFPELEQNQETAVFSPVDATVIAYTEFELNRTLDLWLASTSDGADPVNLTEGRVYAPRFPAWSPDGTRLAFAGYALLEDGSVEGLSDHGGGGANPPDDEIFVLDVASHELTRVTDNAWGDTTPTWAPDGEHLLISSSPDGDADLWLISLDSSDDARNLIDDDAEPREDLMPHWYPGHRF